MCILLPPAYWFAVLHTLVAGLLARSQYPGSPATGHIGTGFSWLFSCVHKRMLRWFPRPKVATACFSCSPPNINFVDPSFLFIYMHNNHCQPAAAHLQLNILLLLLLFKVVPKYFNSSAHSKNYYQSLYCDFVLQSHLET